MLLALCHTLIPEGGVGCPLYDSLTLLFWNITKFHFTYHALYHIQQNDGKGHLESWQDTSAVPGLNSTPYQTQMKDPQVFVWNQKWTKWVKLNGNSTQVIWICSWSGQQNSGTCRSILNMFTFLKCSSLGTFSAVLLGAQLAGLAGVYFASFCWCAAF